MIGADAGRLLGAALVAAAWLVAGWPAAAAMFLVFGTQWLLRWLAGGRLLDHVGQSVLLAAGWFSAVGAYHRLSWLDAVMHALASLVVALLVGRLLEQAHQDGRRRHPGGRPPGAGRPGESRPAGKPPGGNRLGGSRLVGTLAVAGIATSLGVLWEVAEWFGHTYITPEIGVGYDDTIGDLAANTLGALAGAGLAVRAPGRDTAAGAQRAPAEGGAAAEGGSRPRSDAR